jgi:WD40 repeat protein
MRVHRSLIFGHVLFALALSACSTAGVATLEITTTSDAVSPTTVSFELTPTEPAQSPEPTSTPARRLIGSGNIGQLQPFRAFTMEAAIRAVEFSPDGSLLASASGDSDSYEVALWDVESGQLVRKLTGHTAIVWDVTFSPDGQYLASSSKDQTVRVWQVADGAQVHVFNAPGEVTSVAFTPDGRYLAYGGVDSWPVAAVWLVETGTWNQVLQVEEGWNIPAILFTPDSLLMIAGGISRNVRAWYVPQGDQVYIIYFPGQVYDLALSPDSRTLAAAPCTESSANICQNVELWLRDAGSGAIQARIFAGTSPIQALQYSPDGGLLLTGSQDGVLKAWSMPGAEILVTLPLHPGTIEDLAFSPGGDLLATAGSDGTVRVWRAP